MSTERIYISTTIPYVNAPAHLGHALELVQADVLARHHRLAGDEVRFQTGTDDNSLKNVLAAEAEGVAVAELVDRNATAFARLREPLALSFDDFIRTGSDPRHRPGWNGSGGPARPAAIFTSRTTRACTAWAASSSTGRPSWPADGARSTAPRRRRSARRTGSSGCPATPGHCMT